MKQRRSNSILTSPGGAAGGIGSGAWGGLSWRNGSAGWNSSFHRWEGVSLGVSNNRSCARRGREHEEVTHDRKALASLQTAFVDQRQVCDLPLPRNLGSQNQSRHEEKENRHEEKC